MRKDYQSVIKCRPLPVWASFRSTLLLQNAQACAAKGKALWGLGQSPNIKSEVLDA